MDLEVLDYYSDESDDESMDDADDFERIESDLPLMPPAALNGGGLLRRHNAAIFMPLRVSCLYG